MFSVTFIGHQGWLFGTEDTRVLFDGLLVEPFGHKGMVGKVFPPRELHLELFPALDAVFISHEHEDHFNIPSLNRLSRNIPLYLSSRSSVAARQIVAEMGFERVSLFEPGTPVVVGDLELHFFSPDFLRENHSDEWDVLPVLVRDKAGDGSFFSTIDVSVGDNVIAKIRELVTVPGLWCYTNNLTDFAATRMGKRTVRLHGALEATTGYLNGYKSLVTTWGEPAAIVMCGGGWSFEGDLAWLNEQVFPAAPYQVLPVLSAASPGVPFLAPHPGQTIVMSKGKVEHIEPESVFLRAPPQATWPSRIWHPPVDTAPDFGPATGKRAFDDEDTVKLMRELRDFGTSLYGGMLFRALYSLTPSELEGRAPTVLLALRVDDGDGEQAIMLEYSPQSCSFREATADDPVDAYVGGMGCWASDLLAVLRGELAPTAVLFGRARLWCTMPEKFDVTIDGALWMHANALRRPERFLALYREMLRSEPPNVVRIAAAVPAGVKDDDHPAASNTP